MSQISIHVRFMIVLATIFMHVTVHAARADSCPVATVKTIGEVQGAGAASLLTGKQVTLRGRVTGVFQELGGFFIENSSGGADGLPDADMTTSDGIFVFDKTSVSVGEAVQVAGTITEYAPSGASGTETQIDNAKVTRCGTVGTVVPQSVSLPLPAGQTLERYEGMLVVFAQPLYVIENYQLGRFGAVRVADQFIYTYTQANAPDKSGYATFLDDLETRRSFYIDDGSNVQNPDPVIYPPPKLQAANTLRSGDVFTQATGIFRQSYGVPNKTFGATFGYRLHMTMPASITRTNPRPAAPRVAGEITVASANLLNFFNGDGQGGGFANVDKNQRGAYDMAEFNRQWPKTTAQLCALNADVFGLTEIENDVIDGKSAIEFLVAKLNATAECGPYEFIRFTADGRVGTDAIRVAMIYKPATVTKIGTSALISDGSPFAAPFSTNAAGLNKSRVPIAQAFRVTTGKAAGQQFIVVVNHLKSKSGTGSGADADQKDGQGNWNATRTRGAQNVVAWLATDPTGTGIKQSAIVGDMNAYAMEDPIRAFAEGGYVDAVKSKIGMSAYSYTFSGAAGYLDYVLVSNALAAQVAGVAEWHNNADEPLVLDYNLEFISANQQKEFYAADAYRASDHDPTLIGIFGVETQ